MIQELPLLIKNSQDAESKKFLKSLLEQNSDSDIRKKHEIIYNAIATHLEF
jgi:hypothetical protein